MRLKSDAIPAEPVASLRFVGRLGVLLAAFTAMACLMASSTAHAAVLYDQLGNAVEPKGLFSDNFASPDDPFDGQAADDFTVPAGQEWTISQVEVDGAFAGTPPGAVNVFLYASAGALPGAQIFTQNRIAATPSDYVIPITGAPTLGAGTYWLSVQADGGRFTGVRAAWLWKVRGPVSGSPAVYQNPGEGFPGCATWGSGPKCNETKSPDLAFRLSGTSVPVNSFTIGKPVRNLRRGTATVPVTLPGPGTVTVSGRGIARSKPRVTSGAETVRLVIRARGAVGRKLKTRGRATVRATITFLPNGGTPRSETKALRLRKRL